VNSPLNVNPNSDNPVIESQGFDSPNCCEINEPIFSSLQTPLGKKPRCICFPRKSLEQLVDELKGKVSPVITNKLNQDHSDKPTVKKIRKGKKQVSSDLNFMNKRSG
jgi:hypothetical protein